MEMIFNTTTIGLNKYFSTNDWMLQLVLQHDARKKAHSISKQNNKFKQELDIQDETNETASLANRLKKSKEKLKMKKLNTYSKLGQTKL